MSIVVNIGLLGVTHDEANTIVNSVNEISGLKVSIDSRARSQGLDPPALTILEPYNEIATLAYPQETDHQELHEAICSAAPRLVSLLKHLYILVPGGLVFQGAWVNEPPEISESVTLPSMCKLIEQGLLKGGIRYEVRGRRSA